MRNTKYVENVSDHRILYEGCLSLLSPKVVEENKCAGIGLIHSFSNSGDNPSQPPTHVRVSLYTLDKISTEGSEYELFKTKRQDRTLAMSDVLFDLPNLGFFNTGASALRVYQRRPQGNARYRRLPVLSDMSVVTPVREFLDKLQFDTTDNLEDFDILNFWAGSTYEPYTDAVESLFEGRSIARAISSKFCLITTTRSKSVFLMYDNFIAGELKEPTGTLVLEGWAKRFREELETYGVIAE